jgi:hypothetical protein
MFCDDILILWGSPEIAPSARKSAVKVACFPPTVRPPPAALVLESFHSAPEWGLLSLSQLLHVALTAAESRVQTFTNPLSDTRFAWKWYQFKELNWRHMMLDLQIFLLSFKFLLSLWKSSTTHPKCLPINFFTGLQSGDTSHSPVFLILLPSR